MCRRARKGSNRSVGSAPGKPLAASSVGQAGLAWMDAAGPSTYIKELRIKDFALIDHLSIRLGPGLNVVTGESGAGKSVLVVGLPRPPLGSSSCFGTEPSLASSCACPGPPLLLLHMSTNKTCAKVAAVTHILGAAALDDIVRPPATSAAVEAIFHLGSGSVRSIADLLVGAGLPQKAVPGNDAHSHAELLMRREVRLGPSDLHDLLQFFTTDMLVCPSRSPSPSLVPRSGLVTVNS